MSANSPPLIFVWLGPTLPPWFEFSLSLTRLFNPSLSIFLVSDHTHSNHYLSTYSVTLFVYKSSIEDLPIAHSTTDNLFRFWQLTSNRLLYLQHFAEHHQISAFFHAELDNIVFDLSNLHHRLSGYRGLFAPQDSPSRAIGSLIYINNLDSLRDLLECYSILTVKSDMAALGLFASSSTLFHALPTESSFTSSATWPHLMPDQCDGIFDAASIGQYLFGIPKFHTPYSPSRNLFVNENCLIDLKDLRIISLFPLLIDHPTFPKPLSLYNLHVHSKQFSYIHSLFFRDRLTSSLNLGIPVTMGRSYMYLLSPVRRLTRPLLEATSARLQRLFRFLLHSYEKLAK